MNHNSGTKLTLRTFVIGALLLTTLVTTLYSVAMASPDDHDGQSQTNPEKMHDRLKAGLDRLAGRLEIKSSQQAAWEEFAKSVEPLADRSFKKPADDADAATIARNQADRATEFAKKLARVADATAKLQAVLTDDQRKILNQVSRHFLHRNHCGNRNSHGWNRHGDSDATGQQDGNRKNSW
ncbi:MAG: Spy/CpxP family protein refolding chaperone [Nitrosomonadales bacterium]